MCCNPVWEIVLGIVEVHSARVVVVVVEELEVEDVQPPSFHTPVLPRLVVVVL